MPQDSLHPQRNSVLRAERQRVGLSLNQLAAQSRVAKSSVSRIETGASPTPNPQLLQRLARTLGIDVELLYVDAGYLAPNTLPELGPYLRSKYGLPEEAAQQVEEYFDALRDRWIRDEGESHDPPPGETSS